MEVHKNDMSRLMIATLSLGIASAALAQGMPGMPGQTNQQQAGQPAQPAQPAAAPAAQPAATSAPKAAPAAMGAPAAPQQAIRHDLKQAVKQEQKSQADMKKAHQAGVMHPIKDIKYREKADRHADKAKKDLKKAAKLKSHLRKPAASIP